MDMKPSFIKTVHLMSFAAVVAVFGLAAYAFLWFQIGTLSAEAMAEANDLKVARDSSQSAVSLQKSLQNSAISLQIIDSYFLPQNGTVSFVEFLESLGSISGTKVSIQSIGLDKGQVGDFKEVLAVTVDSVGTWSNLMRFISLVESSPYHIDIASADINMNSAKPANEWHALITVKVIQLK